MLNARYERGEHGVHALPSEYPPARGICQGISLEGRQVSRQVIVLLGRIVSVFPDVWPGAMLVAVLKPAPLVNS